MKQFDQNHKAGECQNRNEHPHPCLSETLPFQPELSLPQANGLPAFGTFSRVTPSVWQICTDPLRQLCTEPWYLIDYQKVNSFGVLPCSFLIIFLFPGHWRVLSIWLISKYTLDKCVYEYISICIYLMVKMLASSKRMRWKFVSFRNLGGNSGLNYSNAHNLPLDLSCWVWEPGVGWLGGNGGKGLGPIILELSIIDYF